MSVRGEGKVKLTVIGHKGVVGGATYQLFKRLGYDVTGVDVGDKPMVSDIAFVCVPEGLVTAELLKEYVTGLFVVRSTVLPGACEALEKATGVHVAHNPEFLRESTALMDSFNPDRIIIGGCCRRHSASLTKLYAPLRRPIYCASRKVTELTKLASNAYLATLISYWNEIDELAECLGVSGTEIGMLASTDPRISYYGSRLHDHYGGKCLPKDARRLIDLCRANYMNPALLEAVERVNERCES